MHESHDPAPLQEGGAPAVLLAPDLTRGAPRAAACGKAGGALVGSRCARQGRDAGQWGWGGMVQKKACRLSL